MANEKYLERSAIILAGGFSSRFGEDKGTLQFINKPLIEHVIDAVRPIVDETIIVTNSKERKDKYSKIIRSEVQFVIDNLEAKGPLIGAFTGLKAVHGNYSVLLPFDTPFVSREVVSNLFRLGLEKTAVIPRWPNGHIEPLQAIYKTEPSLVAAECAINEGKSNMRSMIKKLRKVQYVSTLFIQQLDPGLNTFFNINTPEDLVKALIIAQQKERK